MFANVILSEYTYCMENGYRLRHADVDFKPESACAENGRWQRLVTRTI